MLARAEEGNLLRPVTEGVRLAVRVTPRAGRDAITGIRSTAAGTTALQVAVTAAPEDGRANAAVLALLAKAWKRPKSTLQVVVGASNRDKVILVSGDAAHLVPELESWLAAQGDHFRLR